MKCPKCDTALGKVKIRIRPEYGADILDDAEQTTQIEVDQCLACNGIWFDVKELDQYLSEKLLILDSKKIEKHKKLDRKDGHCPKCNELMIKKPAPKGGGFAVDTCKKCGGVWLDSTEIDKLEKKNFSFGQKHALMFRNIKEILFG